MSRAPFLFLLFLVACGPGELNVVARAGCPDQDIRDPDDVCPEGSAVVAPGERVAWVFEVYAQGPFAGTYALTPEMSFDRDVDAESITPSTVTLDGDVATVTLNAVFPPDMCGTGLAGVRATEVDAPERDALATLWVDILVDGDPVPCP